MIVIVIDIVYFSFVCLLKLILYNSKAQNQMCDWNQKISVLFYKNLKSSFSTWLTHLTRVCLHFWFLWPMVRHCCCPTAQQHSSLFYIFFEAMAETLLLLQLWQYCTLCTALHGPIWTAKFENCPPMCMYVFLRTERRNKYCKFEYFKIIQCKVLDHTLKQILYYCYTANCTNEKN